MSCALSNAKTPLTEEQQAALDAHHAAHEQFAARLGLVLPLVLGVSLVFASWDHAGIHALGFGMAVSSLMSLVAWRRLELHCDLVGAETVGVVAMADMIDRVQAETIEHPGSTLSWAMSAAPPTEIRLAQLVSVSPPEAATHIWLDWAEVTRHRTAEAWLLTFLGAGSLLGLFVAPTSPWLAWPLFALGIVGPSALNHFGKRWVQLTLGDKAETLVSELARIDREPPP